MQRVSLRTRGSMFELSSGLFKFDCNAVFPGVSHIEVEKLEKCWKPLGDVPPDSAGELSLS
jgi:hypothetical protein